MKTITLSTLQQIVSLINCHMQPDYLYHVDHYQGKHGQFLFQKVKGDDFECVKMIHFGDMQNIYQYLMGFLECAEISSGSK